MSAGEVLAASMGTDSVIVTLGVVALAHRLVPRAIVPRAKPSPAPPSGPPMASLPPAPPAVAPHAPGAPVAVLPAPQDGPGQNTAAVFAASVKTLRAERGWTTRDLAAECGLSNSTVTAAENCTGRLYLDTAVRIAGALGVPVGEMLGEAAYAREESGRQNLAGIGKESA